MITPRHLAGAAMVISWALLLGARSVAAAIYSTKVGSSYEIGLVHIGWSLPVSAWLSLFGGLFLLLSRPRAVTSAEASSSHSDNIKC